MASENENTSPRDRLETTTDSTPKTEAAETAAGDNATNTGTAVPERDNGNDADTDAGQPGAGVGNDDDDESSDEDASDEEPSTPAPPATFGLIFQAPDPTAVTTSRRSRRVDHDDDEQNHDDQNDDETGESDDDPSEDSGSRGSRRSRRGRRGSRGARRGGRGAHEDHDDHDRDDGEDNDSEDDSDANDSADSQASSEQNSDTDDSGDSADDSDDEGSRSSRRRRRGGRGRRRSGRDSDNADSQDDSASGQDSDDDSDDGGDSSDTRTSRGRSRRGGSGRSDGSGDDSDAGSSHTSEDDSDDESDDSSDESRSSRRRTRRRRRAGSGTDTQDDPPGTTTRVRQSRTDRDEATGIKGSTRLEAKRQRRRDGREAGRRRTIITEAQFLARRESVERVMAIREVEGRTEIGVLEDGVLVEHYLSGADGSSGGSGGASSVGNVYLGRVQNVLPSMEAAFVDIGKNRNGVLYAGEVNWDAAGLEGGNQRRIENALSSGQNVLVQVTKDPIGHKGARLTSQVSLPGRFLVYVPDGSMTGISRKLPDTERARLKSLLKKIVPENAGVIVRTAAEGATEEELTADVERLARQWETIQKKAKSGNGPVLLHGEPGLTVRVVRDVFNEDFSKLVVSGNDAWNTVSEYVDSVAPDLRDRVSKWTDKADLFTTYRIDEQLAKAMDRKVWLPSGGSLVIDRTEAMTVIDVNTGKFTGSGGNLEETVTKNNLEAAEEIVNQLRLRDIGGIIVVDFIDMVLESNRELVVRRLVECLGRDRTKHQVAEVTSLGLVQMTRKRVGAGLIEVFSEPCEHCNGRGIIVRDHPVLPSSEPDSDGRRGRRGKGRRSEVGNGQSNGNTGQRGHSHDHDSGNDSGGNGSGGGAEDNDRKGVSAAAMAKVAAALKSVPADVAEEQAAEQNSADTDHESSADSTDAGSSTGSGRSRRSRRAVAKSAAPISAGAVEIMSDVTTDSVDAGAATDASAERATDEQVDEQTAVADLAGAVEQADAPETARTADGDEPVEQPEPARSEESGSEAEATETSADESDVSAEAAEAPAPARSTRRSARRAASAPAGTTRLEGVGLMTSETAAPVESAPLTSLAMDVTSSDEPTSGEDTVVSGTGESEASASTASRRKPRRRAGSPAGPPTDE